MTPQDIIQEFGLENSTDPHDYLIAADLAEDQGLESFAQFLRTQNHDLMARQALPSEGYGEQDQSTFRRSEGYGQVRPTWYSPGGYGAVVACGWDEEEDLAEGGSGFGYGEPIKTFDGSGHSVPHPFFFGIAGQCDGSGPPVFIVQPDRDSPAHGREEMGPDYHYGQGYRQGHGHGGSLEEFHRLARQHADPGGSP